VVLLSVKGLKLWHHLASCDRGENALLLSLLIAAFTPMSRLLRRNFEGFSEPADRAGPTDIPNAFQRPKIGFCAGVGSVFLAALSLYKN